MPNVNIFLVLLAFLFLCVYKLETVVIEASDDPFLSSLIKRLIILTLVTKRHPKAPLKPLSRLTISLLKGLVTGDKCKVEWGNRT